MDNREERLFRAIGDVGSDLIDTAEHKAFPVSPLRRFLPVAACAAILVTAALVMLPRLKEIETVQPTASAQKSETETEPLHETHPETHPETPTIETGPAVPKERLTILNTVYYREGFYETDEYLGERIGTVSRADNHGLEGAEVYARRDCTWKNGVPLEVFVKHPGGYVYCLTYFANENPLGQVKDLKTWQQILQETAFPAACLGMNFEHPRELTSQELYAFFTMTLALEQATGQRSENLNRYLWYRADLDAYVIPKQDLTRQISRYLHDYVFVPSDCQGYDPQLEAVCVKTLVPEEQAEGLILLEQTTYDRQTGILDLWLRTSETGRILNDGILLTGDDCVFLYMRDKTDVVHPILEGAQTNGTETPKEE